MHQELFQNLSLLFLAITATFGLVRIGCKSGSVPHAVMRRSQTIAIAISAILLILSWL